MFVVPNPYVILGNHIMSIAARTSVRVSDASLIASSQLLDLCVMYSICLC